MDAELWKAITPVVIAFLAAIMKISGDYYGYKKDCFTAALLRQKDAEITRLKNRKIGP